MGNRLNGRVAIVTGASRGIGWSIAQAFADEGASLCLVARNQADLNDVASQLGLDASRVMTQALDVVDRDACFQAVAATIQHFGHVDTLVNNAGVYRSKPFLDFTPQDFQDMLDVNLFGVLHFTQACLTCSNKQRAASSTLPQQRASGARAIKALTTSANMQSRVSR